MGESADQTLDATPVQRASADLGARSERKVLALHRWGALVLALGIAGAVAGWFWASSRTVSHTAAALVIIDRAPFGSLETGVSRPQFEARAREAEGADIAAAVGERLGVAPTAISVDTDLDLDTALVTISVSADNPDLAVAAANLVVEELAERSRLDQVTELERAREQSQSLFEVNDRLLNEHVQEVRELRRDGLDDEAAAVERMMWHVSNRRSSYRDAVADLDTDIAVAEGRIVVSDLPEAASDDSANRPLYAALFGIAAAAAGAVTVTGLAGRSDTIATLADLESAAPDVDLLAQIPTIASAVGNRAGSLVCGATDPGDEAEAFRFARTIIGLRLDGVGAHSLSLTSAEPGAGKTVTAANLAVAVAAAGSSVLLADGDVLSSTSAEALGLADGVSTLPHILDGIDVGWPITTVTTPDGTTVDYLGRTDLEPWTGRRTEVTTQEVRRLLHESSAEYDIAILDCPPVLAVADSIPLCAAADTTVVVVRLGATRRADLTRTLRRLHQAGVTPLGIIATDTPSSASPDPSSTRHQTPKLSR